MKAALGLMLELIKAASAAREIDTITVSFGPEQSFSATKWEVGPQMISARRGYNWVIFDKDEVKGVSISLDRDLTPEEWYQLPLLQLLEALKAANLKRGRNQS
jgi:hypothetical protein